MDDLLKLETETFNKLYTDYRLRFIRFAQTYIPDISIAEDIVMDTLAYYWEHRRDIKNDENILSYLLTAIKHKCLNYLRQERFHYEKNNSLSELALWELDFKISALSACDPCELYTNEVQEIVNHTLEKLPSKTRTMVWLYVFPGVLAVFFSFMGSAPTIFSREIPFDLNSFIFLLLYYLFIFLILLRNSSVRLR